MGEPSIDPNLLSSLGNAAKELTPGLLGSALAAYFGPPRNALERAAGLAFGFCCAAFGTGPVLDFFHLQAITYAGGVGFFLGYFGKSVADSIVATDWASIIKARFGGGS